MRDYDDMLDSAPERAECPYCGEPLDDDDKCPDCDYEHMTQDEKYAQWVDEGGLD